MRCQRPRIVQRRLRTQSGRDHRLAVCSEGGVVVGGADRARAGRRTPARRATTATLSRQASLAGRRSAGNGSCSVQEATSGRIRSRHVGAIQSAATLCAENAHLWKFPTQKSAPEDSICGSSMPGTCAPSTSRAAPRAWVISATLRIGKTRAVGELTWSRTTTRVLGVMWSPSAATTSSSEAVTARLTVTTRPVRVLGEPPGSQPHGPIGVIGEHDLVATSQPQSGQDCADSCSGVGDQGQTRLDPRRGTLPRRDELPRSRGGAPGGGTPSDWHRPDVPQSAWADRTTRGTAPKEPWLRWARDGSRSHCARTSAQSGPQRSFDPSTALHPVTCGDCARPSALADPQSVTSSGAGMGLLVHGPEPFRRNVCVDLGGRQRGMAEQLLHTP